MNSLKELIGAFHIHSTYSDGSWEIPKIAEAAQAVGLDFIVMTDHFTLKPREDGHEKFYGNTLVLIGYEISDHQDWNHYLVLDTDTYIPGGGRAFEYIDKVNEAGGIGIIAHPDEKRNTLKEYPPYPWTEWDCQGYQGIEIWNQLSEWMEGLTRANKFYRFIHPLKSTIAPTDEILKRWDEANLSRKIIGIAGIDAHAFPYKILGLFKTHIFHYKVMLKSLRNHLLIEEPWNRNDSEKARRNVYNAIRCGRLFFSNYRQGDARGFRFEAESRGGTYTIGDEITGETVKFKVKSPLLSKIRLIHNGHPVCERIGTTLEYRTFTPGIYRAEAYRNHRAWVFTNHIRFKRIVK